MSLEDYEECLRESPADVQKRAHQFLDAVVADAMRAEAAASAGTTTTGKNDDGGENARLALVVAHGGILNVMMLTEMDLEEEVGIMGNCAVAVVDVVFEGEGGAGVRYVPRKLNDVSHFEESELPATRHGVENFGH